jgi:SHS2 domain-containing protein
LSDRGITFLDHTADVGLDLEAGSLELLFHRAAVGMLALLRGADDDEGATGPHDADRASAQPAPVVRHPGAGPGLASARGLEVLNVELEADDVARLLADWLRELLFLHDTRHADYARATFDRLTETALTARVQTEPTAPAVREIKGVTYHQLAVEQTGDGWRGRVIFDV